MHRSSRHPGITRTDVIMGTPPTLSTEGEEGHLEGRWGAVILLVNPEFTDQHNWEFYVHEIENNIFLVLNEVKRHERIGAAN